jgi:hypothetical protein
MVSFFSLFKGPWLSCIYFFLRASVSTVYKIGPKRKG